MGAADETILAVAIFMEILGGRRGGRGRGRRGRGGEEGRGGGRGRGGEREERKRGRR